MTHLSDAIRLQEALGEGHYAVASRPLARGTLVLEARPYAIALTSEVASLRCVACLGPIAATDAPTSAGDEEPLECTLCPARYCGAACHSTHAVNHTRSGECHVLRALAESQRNRPREETDHLAVVACVLARAASEGVAVPRGPPVALPTPKAEAAPEPVAETPVAAAPAPKVPGKKAAKQPEPSSSSSSSSSSGSDDGSSDSSSSSEEEVVEPVKRQQQRKRKPQPKPKGKGGKRKAAPDVRGYATVSENVKTEQTIARVSTAPRESIAELFPSTVTSSPRGFDDVARLVSVLALLEPKDLRDYETLRRRYELLATTALRNALVDAARTRNRAPNATAADDELLAPMARNVDAGFFHHLCATYQCNAFGVWDPSARCLGTGVYTTASYFNHSCVPTLCRVMRGRTASFYTTRDVREGEALCISYANGMVALHVRRQHLLDSYRFWCRCDGCENEAAGRPRTGDVARCGRCTVEGYLRYIPETTAFECNVCGAHYATEPEQSTEARAKLGVMHL